MDLLKYTFINPAEESSLISLSSGIIHTEAIRRDLEIAYDKGKSAMDTFIDLRFVNMSKSIYNPLKKLRLGTFTNMNKKVKVKVKGREVQFSSQSEIFGNIALISQSRSVDLQEIFKYPLGSVPYALADSMGTMIKTKKEDLLAELEEDTTYVNSFPKSSCSIFDGMVLVRKVKRFGLTFDKAADEIFNAALSSANRSTRIDIVFDIYKVESIKNVERNRRCSDTLSFKKIVGTNVIRQWNLFLGDNNNKNSLVHFLVNNWREYAMPVNKVICETIGDKCICLNDPLNMPTLFCKQEEADTRIFLHCKHASARFREVIIHTPDTDVFVLALGFAHSLNCELFIKTGVKDKNRIISISRIIDKLKGTYAFQESEIIIQSIIAFHAFTGCDTTSAFWRKGKVRPLHLMLKILN